MVTRTARTARKSVHLDTAVIAVDNLEVEAVPTPVPTSLLLLGNFLAALGLIRRRRKLKG
jgi:hypothetical protein